MINPFEQELPREGVVNSEIEINGPEFLLSDQGLYDQEPFKSIMEKVSAGRKIEPAPLGRILSDIGAAYARNPRYEESGDSRVNAWFTDYMSLRNMAKEAYNLKTSNIAEVQNCTGATRDMLVQLEDYPFWFKYLARIGEFYYKDGSVKPSTKSNPKIQTPSYGKFLEDYVIEHKRIQEIRGRQLLYGIDEVFSPDGFRTPGSLVARKWRVRSNLRSER